MSEISLFPLALLITKSYEGEYLEIPIADTTISQESSTESIPSDIPPPAESENSKQVSTVSIVKEDISIPEEIVPSASLNISLNTVNVPEDKDVSTESLNSQQLQEGIMTSSFSIAPSYLKKIEQLKEYHGHGFSIFNNGNSYEGNFNHGFMHGEGIYTWKNGIKYIGDFKDNCMDGYGEYIWENGSTYKGEIKDGKRNGYGIFQSQDVPCVKYTGQWSNGTLHGKGKLVYNLEETSYYDGEWEEGQKNGKGIMYYENGDVYEGEWSKNVKHGRGVMCWKSKKEFYIGEWKNGVINGFGTYIWEVNSNKLLLPGPNKYEGNWVDGKREGYGHFQCSSGSIYRGFWLRNMKHGEGHYKCHDGRCYVGNFENDRMTEPFQKFCNDSPFSLRLDGHQPSLFSDEEELNQINKVILRYINNLQTVYNYYCKKRKATQLKFLNLEQEKQKTTITPHNTNNLLLQQNSDSVNQDSKTINAFFVANNKVLTENNLVERAYYNDGRISRMEIWDFLEKFSDGLKANNITLINIDREFGELYKDDLCYSSRYNDPHNVTENFIFIDFLNIILRIAIIIHKKKISEFEKQQHKLLVLSTFNNQKVLFPNSHNSLDTSHNGTNERPSSEPGSAPGILGDDAEDITLCSTLSDFLKFVVFPNKKPSSSKSKTEDDVDGTNSLFTNEEKELHFFGPQMYVFDKSIIFGDVNDVDQSRESSFDEEKLYNQFYYEYMPSILALYYEKSKFTNSALADANQDKTMTVRDVILLLNDQKLLDLKGDYLTINQVINFFARKESSVSDGSFVWTEYEITPPTLFDALYIFSKIKAKNELKKIQFPISRPTMPSSESASQASSNLDLKPLPPKKVLSAVDLASTPSNRKLTNMKQQIPHGIKLNEFKTLPDIRKSGNDLNKKSSPRLISKSDTPEVQKSGTLYSSKKKNNSKKNLPINGSSRTGSIGNALDKVGLEFEEVVVETVHEEEDPFEACKQIMNEFFSRICKR